MKYLHVRLLLVDVSDFQMNDLMEKTIDYQELCQVHNNTLRPD